MLLRDLILGRDNAWAQTYAPQRVTLRAAGEYIRENATMVANFSEYVTGGDVSSVDDLKAGEGAVVRRGSQKIAAYRDENGRLHMRSAVCTHASCILRWNAFEKCWDCPCHGSQFSVDGEPLNGPAIHRLAASGASASQAE
jgi:Rieske Fe-S protein